MEYEAAENSCTYNCIYFDEHCNYLQNNFISKMVRQSLFGLPADVACIQLLLAKLTNIIAEIWAIWKQKFKSKSQLMLLTEKSPIPLTFHSARCLLKITA